MGNGKDPGLLGTTAPLNMIERGKHRHPQDSSSIV
jgi:hypothetical protein